MFVLFAHSSVQVLEVSLMASTQWFLYNSVRLRSRACVENYTSISLFLLRGLQTSILCLRHQIKTFHLVVLKNGFSNALLFRFCYIGLFLVLGSLSILG